MYERYMAIFAVVLVFFFAVVSYIKRKKKNSLKLNDQFNIHPVDPDTGIQITEVVRTTDGGKTWMLVLNENGKETLTNIELVYPGFNSAVSMLYTMPEREGRPLTGTERTQLERLGWKIVNGKPVAVRKKQITQL